MNSITIKNQLFKENLNTYKIEWEERKSDFSINQIKIGDDIIIFKIQKDNNKKCEIVKVLKDYVQEIGIENYIYSNIKNWVINYENEI